MTIFFGWFYNNTSPNTALALQGIGCGFDVWIVSVGTVTFDTFEKQFSSAQPCDGEAVYIQFT